MYLFADHLIQLRDEPFCHRASPSSSAVQSHLWSRYWGGKVWSAGFFADKTRRYQKSLLRRAGPRSLQQRW